MELNNQAAANQGALHPAQPRSTADWHTLFTRLFDDSANLLQMEARLFEANLNRNFVSLVDRALAELILASAIIGGGMCLVAALILGLHTFLAWWASLAISGGAVFAFGTIAYLAFRGAAYKQMESTRT